MPTFFKRWKISNSGKIEEQKKLSAGVANDIVNLKKSVVISYTFKHILANTS